MSSFLPRVQLSMLGAASSSSTFAPLWVKVRFVRFCLIFLTNWGCETSRVTGYCCGSRSGKMLEAAPKRSPACSKSYFGSSQHFWNHRNVANSTIWQWLWLSEFKILWCAKIRNVMKLWVYLCASYDRYLDRAAFRKMTSFLSPADKEVVERDVLVFWIRVPESPCRLRHTNASFF